MADSLSRQLLEQARQRSTGGRGRPSQASLRRAVSDAYYALFHFLIAESLTVLVGGDVAGVRRDHRHIVSRTYGHGVMAGASAAFSRAKLPKGFDGYPTVTAIPEPVSRMAELFGRLQTLRHDADYDLSQEFARPEVALLIDEVEAKMRVWPAVKDESMARLYLISLLLWDRIKKS